MERSARALVLAALAAFTAAALARGIGPAGAGAEVQPDQEAVAATARAKDEKAGKVTVPFEMLPTNHMLVEAKINGKGPYRLIFDLAHPITLLGNRASEASGVVDDKAPRAFLFGMRGEAEIDKLEAGGLVARKLPVIVFDHPVLTALGDVIGRRIDGIMGFTLFARYRTTIDYQTKQMTFEPVNYEVRDLLKDLPDRILGPKVAKERVLSPSGVWGIRLGKPIGGLDAPGVPVAAVVERLAGPAGRDQAGRRDHHPRRPLDGLDRGRLRRRRRCRARPRRRGRHHPRRQGDDPLDHARRGGVNPTGRRCGEVVGWVQPTDPTPWHPVGCTHPTYDSSRTRRQEARAGMAATTRIFGSGYDVPGQGGAAAGPGPVPVCVVAPPHPWDGYLAGPENELAMAAAQAMARGEAAGISPLVVHGPSGVGKSRLLAGLVAERLRREPGTVVAHLDAETFAASYAEAAGSTGDGSGDGWPALRARLREADLLILEDLEGLARAPSARDELAHTLDALEAAGASVAVSARTAPGTWPRREWPVRLLSRLQGGLTARIDPPGLAARRRYVLNRAGPHGLTLLADAVERLASAADGYRTLDGWLARLALEARIGSEHAGAIVRARALDAVTVNAILAEEALLAGPAASIDGIARSVAARFGVRLGADPGAEPSVVGRRGAAPGHAPGPRGHRLELRRDRGLLRRPRPGHRPARLPRRPGTTHRRRRPRGRRGGDRRRAEEWVAAVTGRRLAAYNRSVAPVPGPRPTPRMPEIYPRCRPRRPRGLDVRHGPNPPRPDGPRRAVPRSRSATS